MSNLDFAEDSTPRYMDLVTTAGTSRDDVVQATVAIADELNVLDGQANVLNRVAQKILTLYQSPVDEGQKDRAFWVLEALAGKTPQGPSVARTGIMDLARAQDTRAVAKQGSNSSVGVPRPNWM